MPFPTYKNGTTLDNQAHFDLKPCSRARRVKTMNDYIVFYDGFGASNGLL